MLILLHKTDLDQLPTDTPNEVRAKIAEILQALDDNYGIENRTMDSDGGYVLFFADKKDFENTPKESLNLEIGVSTVEYAEIIYTNGKKYINALYLMNNNFCVSLIMPINACPQSLLDELDERETE